ncbi:zinc-binding dehydrogenase [Rhodococcus sp. 114MFTsu3.1]|uniref:zinc-binding dehydrogenase n=1 Tax=Rhodococcus sp. 114MFTsu3.1 TaxID=1172184 RepID=UPI0012DFBA95|nr:Zn-dependent alcohol dehydrogenase [Rhodococcus sp. 114MFTsu3.1]
MNRIKADAMMFTDGSGLELTALDVLPPGPGEIRVRMRASGVCHSDLHVVTGDWGGKSPVVLGHEGSGIIESVGEGVPTSRIGDHVALSWFAPCRICSYCISGRQWACRNTTANDALMADGTTRLRRDEASVYAFLNVGSFAEYAVVPESGAITMPKELPFEIGALIGCAATTGIGAVLNTAQVTSGSSSAVVGCGGVGLSVIMGLALAGANPIIAVDMSDEKLDAARAAGATHVVNANEGSVVDRVMALTSYGVEYAFEAAGRVDTAGQCVDMTAPDGTTVLVGMPSGANPLPLNLLDVTMNGKSILGCSYGGATPALTFPMIADLYLSGKLPLDELVGTRIDLTNVPQAFEEMKAGRGRRSVVTY